MREELRKHGFRQEFNKRRKIIELISELRNKIEEVEKFDPVLKDEMIHLLNDIQMLVYEIS